MIGASSPNADICIDLDKDDLPFEDNSVNLIFAYHTSEHVKDYLSVLAKIHRVLKHGGRLLLGLPYMTETKYCLSNPQHLHNFNEYSFDYFEPKRLKGSASENNQIIFRKIFHRYHYIGRYSRVPEPFRSWCQNHLFNVVRKIDFGLIAIKNPSEQIQASKETREDMLKQFDSLYKSRIEF